MYHENRWFYHEQLGSPDIKDLDVANYGFDHQKTGVSLASQRLAPIASPAGGGILIVYAEKWWVRLARFNSFFLVDHNCHQEITAGNSCFFAFFAA